MTKTAAARPPVSKPVASARIARLAGGTAISKSCAVMMVLNHPVPLRLSEIAEAAGLNRVTTLRILEDLTAAGFVARLENPPRYAHGPEILAIAANRSENQSPAEALRPGLIRLAALSGDTVLLSLRSGAEAICVERHFGDYPIRANYLSVGSRRPLGIGAGSMALLAALPREERRAMLDLTMQAAAVSWPQITRGQLEGHIAAQHSRGYVAVYDLVVDLMGAIGMPVTDLQDRLVGAVSIVGLSQRIRAREAELAAALRLEVQRYRRSLAEAK